ncbi:MAG: DUF4317 domain-containing protein [Eubacteriales bacterium]|nr:DUF4317 domain-containing protein [Eubacteriales bacterium]
MNKKEIAEIKKQYTLERCPAARICGCYVDGEKNKKTQFRAAFQSLPEEELFKYLNILRKTMSGTLGKNLLNMEFSLETEQEGGTQELLMKLKYTGLQDDGVLEEFYDKVIESYYYVGNYLILLVHGTYDIPGKSSDNQEMFDASEEVYEHIICCICPVNLAKPCLSYDEKENCFTSRIQDWLVEMPLIGFLFPAFHDRSADIHSLLYYNQKPELPGSDFVEAVLGCTLPMTAGGQKETFKSLVEETLGDECSYEMVRTIHENLNEMIEEQKEEPTPLVLGKQEVKRLLEQSGAEEECLSRFDEQFEALADESTEFVASNVASLRKFEIKTPDVLVQVNPEHAGLVETKVVDGRKCLVIEINDGVQVNGIQVK